MQPQTWWNRNIESKLNIFKFWIGDENAESKLYIARYLANKSYKTFLDVGCGTATMKSCLSNNGISIQYTGVDSCEYLINLAKRSGIEIINSDVRNMNNILDSSYEYGFSRHVFEHQESFRMALDELIRVSKYEASHIFFIKPSDREVIKYTKIDNLYHNIYSRVDIDTHLQYHKKVNSWKWVDINAQEIALHIILK
jgi:ubiquinone/menaquinone biosynthesis C-methylase UbiE